MARSAREAALIILERCRRDGAFSDALLSSVIEGSSLSARDAALAARLSYGTLQNMALCDFYISCYADNAGKIEPKVRDILRLSVYQILFMDKVPDRAAVSEGVELCRSLGYSRASGFVNAVLRKIADNKDNLPKIPRENIAEYLSREYSHPLPLTNLLLDRFGARECEAFMAANNADAPTTIQVNTLKTTAKALMSALTDEGIDCLEHPWLPDCLTVRGNVFDTDCFDMGLFYAQDAASRLAVIAAAPRPGQRVLDCCAAPGGKSFAAAIAMGDEGFILARDLHENKLKRLRDSAHSLGITIINVRTGDAANPDEGSLDAFNIVLADVPCSGLGVIRKKPDVRYKDISDIAKLPDLQLSILEGAARCVKAGGVLLYSTCTVLSRENEGVVEAFLENHPEFAPEAFELPEPIGAVEGGSIQLLPHRHGTDGFFICKLRKRHEA